METPNNFVILQINNDLHKVFATWKKDDRWKLNSGIKKIKQDKDYYYFEGYSGSVYKCSKSSYGNLTFYGSLVLKDLIEKAQGQIKLLTEEEFLTWI